METPVKHQSLEAEGTCVSVREQISAGDWKQHQSPKAPACWKTELSLYKVEPDEVGSGRVQPGLDSSGRGIHIYFEVATLNCGKT